MERLNPFLKAITVVIAGILLSFSHSAVLNGAVFFSGLLLLLVASKAKIWQIAKIMIPATLAALSLFFSVLWSGGNTEALARSLDFAVMSRQMTSFGTALQLGLRIYAYAILGMLFALTTDAEEFVYSLMHQCRLAPKFAYGVLSAFHLVPVVKREYETVKLAYKARGYKVSPLSLRPVFTLLVNTMHWSESIAMAMEAKGFDGDGKRTYYHDIKISWYDILFLLGVVGILLYGLLTSS